MFWGLGLWEWGIPYNDPVKHHTAFPFSVCPFYTESFLVYSLAARLFRIQCLVFWTLKTFPDISHAA